MLKSIDEVGDIREGISVLDGMRIDVAVVLAGMKCTILLWDKEEGERL